MGAVTTAVAILESAAAAAAAFSPGVHTHRLAPPQSASQSVQLAQPLGAQRDEAAGEETSWRCLGDVAVDVVEESSWRCLEEDVTVRAAGMGRAPAETMEPCSSRTPSPTPLVLPVPHEPQLPQEVLPVATSSVLAALESLSGWTALPPRERANLLFDSAANDAAETTRAEQSEGYFYMPMPPASRTPRASPSASAGSVSPWSRAHRTPSPSRAPPASLRIPKREPDVVGKARLLPRNRKSERAEAASATSPRSETPIVYGAKRPWAGPNAQARAWEGWNVSSPQPSARLEGSSAGSTLQSPRGAINRIASIDSKPNSPRNHTTQENFL